MPDTGKRGQDGQNRGEPKREKLEKKQELLKKLWPKRGGRFIHKMPVRGLGDEEFEKRSYPHEPLGNGPPNLAGGTFRPCDEGEKIPKKLGVRKKRKQGRRDGQGGAEVKNFAGGRREGARC